MREDSARLVGCAEFVGGDTDEEVHRGEGEFGLAELECVSKSDETTEGLD